MTPPLDNLTGIKIGDQVVLISGKTCNVRHIDGDVAYIDVPGARYGTWLSITHPCVTGMTHMWPIQIIKDIS